MSDLISTDRFKVRSGVSATDGQVSFLPTKSLWLLLNGLLGIVGIFLFPQIDALLVFLALTALTICAGHSVGMHRLLIHRSFSTPIWLEYILVWLGTLVGMAGPVGMIRTHDLRDWHQRQKQCPDHPSHRAAFFKDAFWQLCCEFKLRNAPKFVLESRVSRDQFYRFLEATWMLQQLPLALLLFTLGGWAWVLWGCCLRVFVSLTGHWMVGHFAHRQGQQGWKINGVPVQGYNLPRLGIITFGENWHGNHHAFPYSAKLGVEDGQTDPGYVFISVMERIGLAWDIKQPGDETDREGLIRVDS